MGRIQNPDPDTKIPCLFQSILFSTNYIVGFRLDVLIKLLIVYYEWVRLDAPYPISAPRTD